MNHDLVASSSEATRPGKRHRFLAYLIWVLVFSAIVELLASHTLSTSEPGFAPGTPIPKRNPYFRRGWPAYTSALAETSKKRLVVIGNSQAFGRELFEDDIYTARLNALLDREMPGPGASWQVENWGVPGAIGHDLALLTAKALDQRADVVLIISHVSNFHKPRHKITYSLSDIPLIVAEPSVLAKLPWSFLARYVGVETVVTCFFDRLANSRRANLCDFLQQHCDLDLELIYGEAVKDKETGWFNPPKRGFSRPADPGNVTIEKTIQDGDPSYLENFRKMAACSPKTKVIFASMPLCKAAMSPESIKTVERFNHSVRERLKGDKHLHFWDMTWVLPPEHFYSYTHCDPVNHANMAGILYDRLVGEGII